MDKNVLQQTRAVEKKTAKGVKSKVKDDHLHFAQSLIRIPCLIQSIWNVLDCGVCYKCRRLEP